METLLAGPGEKLADSLKVLKSLQAENRRVFQSKEFGRVHRERLLRNGFLREVMKGWVISASPGTGDGDSTTWFASFWEFCARYCHERFGEDWHLSPEQSLLLHAGNTVIPTQIIFYSPKGKNNTVHLLFNTSLYDLKQKNMSPRSDIIEMDGLRIYTVPVALTKVSESFYQGYPVEAQVVLSRISDGSDLLRPLLAGGHSAIAGRLVGALRRMGKNAVADDVASGMKAAEYTIRETDPFEANQQFVTIIPSASPIVARLQAMWETHRGVVIEKFPVAPGLPKNQKGYLQAVDEIYKSDAYHSLSIEGYRVTPELIDRVRSGAWNPDQNNADQKNRDALAARGYWQAFQLVKEDVTAVIGGQTAADLVRRTHRNWYRELFQPCVTAGLIGTEVLAGYRNDAVYLRTSRYVPPRWEAVRDAMPTLFDLFSQEKEPSVRAVLGHWFFGYIHPYPDGNGRMARFLMNVMLASGGYPWTVIRVEDRNAYLAALEAASVDANIEPFAQFIAERVGVQPK